MLKSKQFYHSHTRKVIVAFGLVFNKLVVNRLNTDASLNQSIVVPLSYAVKQKFIERIQAAPSLDNGRAPFEVVLPRMSYEIVSLAYEPARKLTTTTSQRAITTVNGINSAYVSTPYLMGISLTIYAKNQDDGLQILEQILPYFNPDFNVRLNELPELGVVRDLQINLDSVTTSQEYEGPLDKRTMVTWDLNFSIRMNYFGYVETANVIKKTIVSLFATPTDGMVNKTEGIKIITTPSPLNADPSGTFDYMQEFDLIEN